MATMVRLMALACLVACASATWPSNRSSEEGETLSAQPDVNDRSLQTHSRTLAQVAANTAVSDTSDPTLPGNSITRQKLNGVPPFILTGNEAFTVTDGVLEFQDLIPADGLLTIYTMYYGNWGVDANLQPLTLQTNPSQDVMTSASAVPILENFISGIGTSDWWSITKTYCLEGVPEDPTQTSGGCAGTPVHDLGNSDQFAADNSYSVGTMLDYDTVKRLIVNTINSGALAYDPQGMYLILISADVTFTGQAENDTSRYCTQSCGYHGAVTVTEADINDGTIIHVPGVNTTGVAEFAIPYAIIGNPGASCQACQGAYTHPPFGLPGNTFLPNNNIEADSMVSIMAHELTEAFSDPQFKIGGNITYGFYDGLPGGDSYENGDKCINRWEFPTYHKLDNGQHYTNIVANTPYIIQANWLPVLSSPDSAFQVGCVSSVPPKYAGNTFLNPPQQTDAASSPVPDVESPIPDVESPVPDVESPVPDVSDVESPVPDVESPGPDVESPGPDVESPVPDAESPGSGTGD